MAEHYGDRGRPEPKIEVPKKSWLWLKNSNGKFITINTKKPTPWNYGFLGVIKMTKKPTPSKFDIEEFNGKEFPFKD